ncbi:hypothetical protein PC111_g20325 [Phytophthora cactorum]|nr:hypothetical protein PC112_g20840 [Phytophthora cactorum]KAG2799670.1 hypothetical protein PC111_g20325 [Phytophthora cactorum]KAG2897287.1 hypothetical protein PC117_g22814 [Phytophthora cactorum]
MEVLESKRSVEPPNSREASAEPKDRVSSVETARGEVLATEATVDTAMATKATAQRTMTTADMEITERPKAIEAAADTTMETVESTMATADMETTERPKATVVAADTTMETVESTKATEAAADTKIETVESTKATEATMDTTMESEPAADTTMETESAVSMALTSVVSEAVADMVNSVAGGTVPTPVRPPVLPTPSRPTSVGKRKRTSTSRQRNNPRGLLQEDVAVNADDSTGDDSSAQEDYRDPTYELKSSCTVDSDANMMTEGADRCTALNSEEDSDGCDEPEDDADSDGSADWVCDWDIGDLSDEELEEAPEEIPNSIWSSTAKAAKMLTAMRHSDPSKIGPDPTYAGLCDRPYGPSDSVLDVADDPLALLFYFMPPQLRRQIAIESNTYHTQSITKRARAIRAQQRRNGGDMEKLAEIRRRLSNVRDIEPWEVLRVVALLIARMLVPIRKGIAAHWSTAKLGAMPSNRFGLYMPKNRLFYTMGYMQLSNNKSPEAHRDHAWKIRPVVDVLQRTFARGYKPPPVISFDEATLPSTSRFNPMRVFNKDKPHK